MSGFKSDAQRKHFFATGGGVSGFGVAVAVARALVPSRSPAQPVLGPGDYVHTIVVNGVPKQVVLNHADDATADERAEMDLKEIRKSHDFQ